MAKRNAAKLNNSQMWICKSGRDDGNADVWLGEKPRWVNNENMCGWSDPIGARSYMDVDCQEGTDFLDAMIGDGKKWANRPGRSIWRVKLECKRERTDAENAATDLKKLGEMMEDKGDRELLAKAAKLLGE